MEKSICVSNLIEEIKGVYAKKYSVLLYNADSHKWQMKTEIFF